MKALVIGGGGREHALAWKLARCRSVEQVFVAPGNAGTALEDKVENVAIAAEDLDSLCAFAREQRIDLTVVGPEAPLVAGLVDTFTAAGLACFGPSQAAAQLEGSKTFSKEFLSRHRIPTAAYGSFTEVDEAVRFIRRQGAPIVVKADGLAAGKGVVIARNEEQANAAVREMLSGNAFGEAGHRVLIEEYLHGEEASFIVMADGEHVLPMASSQDHKARDEGDTGPNTGGMGAYSPAPVVTDRIHQRILEEVIEPTIRGMAAEGRPYTGFLYAGLMIAPDGTPNVLEFNCRFGDPETQPILLRLQSDLSELCQAALQRRLHQVRVDWEPRPSLAVVMAAGNYPQGSSKGAVITGLDQDFGEDVKVFHAGTRLEGGQVLTHGGRVLTVTALGDSVAAAQARAYQAVDGIHWQDAYCRPDIGYRAIEREQTSD